MFWRQMVVMPENILEFLHSRVDRKLAILKQQWRRLSRRLRLRGISLLRRTGQQKPWLTWSSDGQRSRRSDFPWPYTKRGTVNSQYQRRLNEFFGWEMVFLVGYAQGEISPVEFFEGVGRLREIERTGGGSE